MRLIYRALSVYAEILMGLACLALALMMLHVTADVFGKYLFGQPILGTLETVSHYYMVAAIFLPIALVQAARGQVIVDVATQHLSPRRLALVEGLASLGTLVFVLALLWNATGRAVAMTLITEKTNAIAFPIDIWPSRWFVVLGAAGMAGFVFLQTINDFGFAFTGRRVFAEAAPESTH